MILAAGLGTRLKPFTDNHPKALVKVNGKSLLQRNVEYLQAFGITDVIVNVHHFARQVVHEIETNRGWGSKIHISDETDAVLETGGGLLKAAEFLSGGSYFALLNVDVLTDLDVPAMIAFHVLHRPIATLATTNRKTSRYFIFNQSNCLVGWKNTVTGEVKGIVEPHDSYELKAFSGVHIINSSIFSLVTQRGKFSMVDVYLDLMVSQPIMSFDHSHGKFIDVGKPESIQQACKMFNP